MGPNEIIREGNTRRPDKPITLFEALWPLALLGAVLALVAAAL